MKAICTDKYIIPISSVNYVEHYHGTAIAVYLKNPVAGTTRLFLEYDDLQDCNKAYAAITTTLARE